MRTLSKIFLSAAAGASVLAFSAVTASADIACNRNVCWHQHEHYDYPPDARVIIHPDDWHWGRGEHFTFREHEGRGYWRDGRWREW